MLLNKGFRFNKLFSNSLLSRGFRSSTPTLGWNQPAILAYGVPLRDDQMAKIDWECKSTYNKPLEYYPSKNFYDFYDTEPEEIEKLQTFIERNKLCIIDDKYDIFRERAGSLLVTSNSVVVSSTGWLVNRLLLGPIDEEFLKTHGYEDAKFLTYLLFEAKSEGVDYEQKRESDNKSIKALLESSGVNLKEEAPHFYLDQDGTESKNKKLEDMIGYYALFIG